MPVLWATQLEVKEKLEVAQEEDGQRAIRYLAKGGRGPSASSQLLINWGLDREQIAKILRHLEGDGALQTPANNLVDVTRFNANFEVITRSVATESLAVYTAAKARFGEHSAGDLGETWKIK